MMWLVRVALQRPYTFVVMAMLIAILGIGSIFTMPIDIFPAINIPVVSVIWTYTGLLPNDMEKRIVLICERAMTTTVDDIQHLESRSYPGVAVIRVYFQPNVHVELAFSQVTIGFLSPCRRLALHVLGERISRIASGSAPPPEPPPLFSPPSSGLSPSPGARNKFDSTACCLLYSSK